MARKLCVLAGSILCLALSPAGASNISDARREIARLRYDDAAKRLVEIARASGGEEKQEALYLLAGLKSSVSEAQMIYQEVVQADPSSVWGERSQIELAKIQYAIGDYGQAYRILERSAVCEHSEEACYFEGLSASMLNRYDEARLAFDRVHGGSLRPWAYLGLAEIDMKLHNSGEACRKYRAMTRSDVGPTAMYRYAECLETTGKRDEAVEMFDRVVRDHPSTPEAVLAGQKLESLRDERTRPVLEPAPGEAQQPLSKGFTVQFGSFHDRTNAIKLMAELKPRVPGVRIDSDLVNYREVHRVRFGYFESREQAQKKADELRKHIDEPINVMTLP
jgi:tetratricopeptide (TPR) repeat protein